MKLGPPYSATTTIWVGAHIGAIAAFLVAARPLWNHGPVGGCYDAGDSFYLLARPFPILVVGLIACLGGALYSFVRRRLSRRPERPVVWLPILFLWVAAALFAAAMIHVEDVSPC